MLRLRALFLLLLMATIATAAVPGPLMHRRFHSNCLLGLDNIEEFGAVSSDMRSMEVLQWGQGIIPCNLLKGIRVLALHKCIVQQLCTACSWRNGWAGWHRRRGWPPTRSSRMTHRGLLLLTATAYRCSHFGCSALHSVNFRCRQL